jgi:hypothetical protein
MSWKERSKKGKQTDKHTKRERFWVQKRKGDRNKQTHKERKKKERLRGSKSKIVNWKERSKKEREK